MMLLRKSMKARLNSPLVLRTSLIVTIATGLTAASVNYLHVKHRIEMLRADLAAQTTIAQKAESELGRTQGELEKTQLSLKVTRTELEQTTADKQMALATVTEQTKLAEKRGKDLTSTREELEEAQRSLARYRMAGLEPEQIINVAGQIKSLEKSQEVIEKRNSELEKRLRSFVANSSNESSPVPLPVGLKGKVISTDPKWRFLVIDVGADEGVVQNGELLVRRGDKLIGKAKISRVEKDRCVANVMSGWDLGEIQEGDVAIPATPGLQGTGT